MMLLKKFKKIQNKDVIELIEIKSKREIELMREASKIASQTQKRVEELIRPGISTIELDRGRKQIYNNSRRIKRKQNIS